MSVDWDLLADHLGGALAGTAAQERVAALVAQDPEWARAAAQLSRGLAAVATDLEQLPPADMPPEVASRLDEAIASASTGGAGRSPQESGPGAQPGHGPRRPPGRPAGRPAGRPRARRWGRWGAGLAVAASVLAFTAVGFGAWQLTSPPTVGGDDAASVPDTLSGPTSGRAEDPGEGAADEPRLLASGRDYRDDAERLLPPTDSDQVPELEGQVTDEVPGVATGPAPGGGDLVPPALARLWSDPDARAECLRLVAGAVRPEPGTPEVVDFAHFQGSPALMIWLTDADGARWVWVVGPDCGEPGAGLDERFQVRLG